MTLAGVTEEIQLLCGVRRAVGAAQHPGSLTVSPLCRSHPQPPALSSLLGQCQQRGFAAALNPQLGPGRAAHPGTSQAHPSHGDVSQAEPLMTSALSWCHRGAPVLLLPLPCGAGVLLRDPKRAGVTRGEPNTQHQCSDPWCCLAAAPSTGPSPCPSPKPRAGVGKGLPRLPRCPSPGRRRAKPDVHQRFEAFYRAWKEPSSAAPAAAAGLSGGSSLWPRNA